CNEIIMSDTKPRWVYRFDNFGRGFLQLRSAMELATERPLSELEKIGVIQCFQFTWELAWKTLKDYLEASGIVLETITPAATIKAAFEAKVIADGDAWMAALETRNLMSHTYNMKTFEEALSKIKAHYVPMFEAFYLLLQKADAT